MAKKTFQEVIERASQASVPDPEALRDRPMPSRGEVDGTDRLAGARQIPIARIRPDPDQPRRLFDADRLEELSASIRAHGVVQPISVEYVESGDYFRIISGERRYRAAGLAGMTHLPCMVQTVGEEDRLARQLIENIQREDLSPMEKARGLLELKARLGSETPWLRVEELTGLSERRRKQFIALLNLPQAMQEHIVGTGSRPARNELTEKHARALLKLRVYPERQQELFDLVRYGEEPLSGDAAAEWAKRCLEGGETPPRRLVIAYKTTEELIGELWRLLLTLERGSSVG